MEFVKGFAVVVAAKGLDWAVDTVWVNVSGVIDKDGSIVLLFIS